MDNEDWIVGADRFCQDPNPYALQSWIRSIPTHEFGALSAVLPRVYDTIQQLNANADQLLSYAELLRPTLQQLIKALGQTNIKQFESREAAHTFTQCYLKLLWVEADLYERIFKKAHAEKAETSLLVALHRCMSAQLCIHLAYYQFYLPMPAKEWLKLHKFFYLAIQRKQGGFSATDSSLFPGQRLTISNLYIIALLLGCARVNKLTPADINTTYELLKSWVGLVSISRTPSERGDNQLVVDIAAGAAPNFYKLFTATEKSAPCYLQIEPLLRRIDSILHSDSSNNFSAMAIEGAEKNRGLILHLKSAWSEYLHREERISTNESAFACIGLPAIHYYLCGNQTLSDFIGLKSALSVVYEDHDDISTIINYRNDDVWSPMMNAPDGEINFDNIPADYNFQRHFETDFSQPSDEYPLFPVVLADESSHGYRVAWPIQNKELPLSVGELIALKTEDSKYLKIGVVMWMDYISSTVLHTGIKIISASAFPVGIDIPLKAATQKNLTEAILLPPEDEFNAHISLLVEPDLFNANDYSTISQKNIDQKIKLAELIKSGPSYHLYECGFIIKQ